MAPTLVQTVCATARCISLADRLTPRPQLSRPGRVPSFCARFRNTRIGSWRSAPHSKDARWMGHAGVEAIKQGLADAYWGNAMRVAIGEQLGVAKLHLDLRRGDGPPGARWYNFAALATTAGLINEQPQIATGAVRAIVETQKALKADPSLAAAIGARLFPP